MYISLSTSLSDTQAEERKNRRQSLNGSLDSYNTTSSIADASFSSFRTPPLTEEQENQLDCWEFRLANSKDDIEQHVTRRIFLLFVQAVLCHNTKASFSIGPTIHQGLNAKTLNYNGKKLAFQAAHSATIPCLYKQSPGIPSKEIFYYRSCFYDSTNATLDVLKVVNDADRAIDEKYSCSTLRDTAIELLNQTATGKLDPEQVLQQFCVVLIEQIQCSYEQENNKEVKDVLELYQKIAENVWSYIDQPQGIDNLLNLKIEALSSSPAPKGPLNRQQVLTLIKTKVDELRISICAKQDCSRILSLPHLHDLYHLLMLRQLTPQELLVAEEAIGIKLASLQAKALQRTGATQRFLNQNRQLVQTGIQQIKTLVAHLQGGPLTDLDPLDRNKLALRNRIYQQRFSIIQADQAAQSKIKTAAEHALSLIKNQTAYFNLFFYQTLFNKCTASEQLALSKLLHLSPSQVDNIILELKVNRKCYNLLEKHSSLINHLINQLNQLCTPADLEQKERLKNCIEDVYRKLISSDDPKYLKTLFYHRLYQEVKAPEAILLLNTLYAHEQVIQTIQTAKKIAAAEKTLQKQNVQEAIAKLYLLFQAAVATLKQKTASYRARLLNTLRAANGMTLDIFKKHYDALFPQHPISKAYLSQLGNQSGIASPFLNPKQVAPLISRLAVALRVDKSLFYPSHFAEEI